MEFKDYVQLAALLLNLSGLLYVLKKTSREELNKVLTDYKTRIERSEERFNDLKEKHVLLSARTEEHISLTRERFNKIDEMYKNTIEDIEENLSKMSNNQTWISDGMIRIAAKLSVDLEKRPLL